MHRRILFICSQNKLRSPTAEAVYASHPGVDVDSAGLNHDAEVPLSPEQIEWADLILVMEKSHRNKLKKKFRKYLSGKRVAVLDIPDNYDYMDPALVDLIKRRCAKFIPTTRNKGAQSSGRGGLHKPGVARHPSDPSGLGSSKNISLSRLGSWKQGEGRASAYAVRAGHLGESRMH
jgi:predicted protein tyrosine phosphatase